MRGSEAVLPTGKWEPIETAPHDGRKVLLGWIANETLEWAAVSWWDGDHWRDHWTPTHWQPIEDVPRAHLDRLYSRAYLRNAPS